MKKLLLIISAGIIFLLLPLLTSAQAPNLGTAGTFGLFTSIGAVGNTGQSQVTGNVGTNNGAITGFGNVNGVMHNSNVTTATAASDLLIANNLLNSAIPTFFIAPLIGNGDKLVAGVYSIAGVTYVTGDVGTNVGIAAGFDALNVTGTIHPIPDVSTAQAAADLVVAYNYLNVLPYNLELMYPAQFGNDLVLTPNTYLMNAAASFNGNLYLNTEGNSNAVFVIQVNGALSTSTFSKVILMNGAKANNVFWKVDGAASINDYSVFHGTIIVNNGGLNLATGDSLYGRAFTTSGALSVTAMTTISPKVTCIPLPVNWLYFRGKSDKTNVLLEWGTAVEVNNQYFTIEKSRDGVRFENLGTVKSATGNERREYSLLDVNPYTLGYYRISQTDRDGRRNYYRTIQVGVAETSVSKVIETVKAIDILLQITGANPGPVRWKCTTPMDQEFHPKR